MFPKEPKHIRWIKQIKHKHQAVSQQGGWIKKIVLGTHKMFSKEINTYCVYEKNWYTRSANSSYIVIAGIDGKCLVRE